MSDHLGTLIFDRPTEAAVDKPLNTAEPHNSRSFCEEVTKQRSTWAFFVREYYWQARPRTPPPARRPCGQIGGDPVLGSRSIRPPAEFRELASSNSSFSPFLRNLFFVR